MKTYASVRELMAEGRFFLFENELGWTRVEAFGVLCLLGGLLSDAGITPLEFGKVAGHADQTTARTIALVLEKYGYVEFEDEGLYFSSTFQVGA